MTFASLIILISNHVKVITMCVINILLHEKFTWKDND